ncbi:MAG: hypothetical protein ACRDHM_04490, partial [Actinomycetota bacterium]
MRVTTRPSKRRSPGLWAAMLAAALLVSASPTGAVQPAPWTAAEDTTAAVPGDQQLVNFAHVYNFKTTGPDAEGRGTDLEFYSADVPKRDYDTGQLLDAAGNPLPGGDPPVIVTRDFSIMGSYQAGAWVFDITDPENVQFVKNIPCNQTQNDIQIKRFGDRWILALARDGNTAPCVEPSKGGTTGAGIAVFDVTDPYMFTPMYSFRTMGGAHNFTFHPTKPFGWVSTGDLPGGNNHIPVIDFTNVDEPTLAADISIQGGPHDIAFTPDGLRAYVAAENNYRIFDTTDPKAPVSITSQAIPNSGTYAHGFDPTPDRKLAVATNESLALGGFLAPGTAVCPGEGLTFYRVEGDAERNPARLGTFLASITGPVPPGDSRACTGHVGKLGNKAMTLGWYIGGVRVVDYTDPSQPKEIGAAVMPGAEVWSAKFYKGPYVYASDLRRGFDVFRWTGAQPPPWEDAAGPLPKGPPPCLTPTLVGGAGDSVLTGTSGNDVIVDTNGDNTIRGNGGNDTICTGPGNDNIVTLNGSDVVVDEGGTNRIVTGGGKDNVTTGGGRDVVKTAGGRDRVTTGAGRDQVNGGGGKDDLRSGSGKDVVRGGSGRD